MNDPERRTGCLSLTIVSKFAHILSSLLFVVVTAGLLMMTGCVGDGSPCTKLATVKASTAEDEVQAYTVHMEAYTAQAEEYSGLREAVELVSKAEELSALTKELAETDVCLVLADEYSKKAEEATEWVEAWDVLVAELTSELRAHTKAEDTHTWYAKNSDGKAEHSEEMAKNGNESSEPVVCESLNEGACWRYMRSQCEYNNKTEKYMCFDFWTSSARRLRRIANDERRKARAYLEKAEEAKIAVSVAQMWLQTSTEQAEAFTALEEGYTALSKQDPNLSELSIALVAEAYTTLSKTYTEQALEFTGQTEELSALAEAYTALEKASVVLAESK